LNHTPRPMGRPVQPEVIADAVFRAARGSWREYWVGFPTLWAILGNAILPGYLDRYLARTGILGQQTSQPVQAGRPDNLDAPVTALHRTRGSFSSEAKSRAPLVVGEIARVGMFAAGALVFLVLGTGVGLWVRRR
jgi:hypothetical protein